MAGEVNLSHVCLSSLLPFSFFSYFFLSLYSGGANTGGRGWSVLHSDGRPFESIIDVWTDEY